MRYALLALVATLAGCPHPRSRTTPLGGGEGPVGVPGTDLVAAGDHPGDGAGSDSTVPDPRRGDVTDLDVIHLTVVGHDRDGGAVIEATTPGPLLEEGNAAFTAGKLDEAIRWYRKLADSFPDSAMAPAALYNIGLAHEKQDTAAGLDGAVAAYVELATAYPASEESQEGELRAAAIDADRARWSDAAAMLAMLLARDDLALERRLEGQARLGFVQLQQGKLDDAAATFEGAVATWRRATRIEDSYYIAMAFFYLGEVEHRRFAQVPMRSADAQLAADMETRRVLVMKAYGHWREALGFKIAYWAIAAGYNMSEIFFEYWKAAVTAPYPDGMQPQARPAYVVELHDQFRENLEKALDGHGANVDLAAAYGVDTEWSLASKKRAAAITAILDREARGEAVVP